MLHLGGHHLRCLLLQQLLVLVSLEGYRRLYIHPVLLLAGLRQGLGRNKPSCLRCKTRRMGRFLTNSSVPDLLLSGCLCCLLGFSNSSGSCSRNNYSCFLNVALDFRDELSCPFCFLAASGRALPTAKAFWRLRRPPSSIIYCGVRFWWCSSCLS